METDTGSKRIALLIDAENTQCIYIDFIMEEAGRYGTTQVKPLYGDFTNPGLSCWHAVAQRYGFAVAQKFAYKKGKNSTNIELIIDAIELKERHKIDGVVLVSGDNDYSGLALRYREDAILFVAIGHAASGLSLRSACSQFIEYPQNGHPVELLVEPVDMNVAKQTVNSPKLPGLTIVGKVELEKPRVTKSSICNFIRQATHKFRVSDGYTDIRKVIEYLRTVDQEFSIKAIGYSTIGKFISQNASKYNIDFKRD